MPNLKSLPRACWGQSANSKPFLLEIGTEEIPASYLEPYSRQLKKLFVEQVAKLNLKAEGIQVAYTPRRLTLFCAELDDRQPVEEMEMRGPPKDVAFKDGKPTRAAKAFAKKSGVRIDRLETRSLGNKEYLFAQVVRGGAKTADLLQEVIVSVIRRLKSPKSMRWDDKPTVFARPIRWLVAIFGHDIIPADLDGLIAGRTTSGHRFLSPGEIPLESADWKSYSEELRAAHVILNAAEREEEILRQLLKHGAIEDRIDQYLVSTCANLVEWPSVVRGSFPPEMLELPEPVLVTALKKHQKSFLVCDESGNVAPAFLSVANNDLADEDRIRSGYERVVVARLADARFFWNGDRKKKLSDRVDDLKSVVFQEKLGSYYDKTMRVQELVKRLARAAGRADLAEAGARAALLSRADLTTAMVCEFPNLQGTMGGIYARVTDGEPYDVCIAIEEMYKPRTADDALPASAAGALLSIADKLDTLVGCCAVGLGPTGSADPYALRRQALGLLRTVVHHGLRFSMDELLKASLQLFENAVPISNGRKEQNDSPIDQVLQILRGRLETVLKDAGIRYDIINAALASGWDDVDRTVDKSRQLMTIIETEEFRKACTVIERCHNITRDVSLPDTDVDIDAFAEPLERELWAAWQTARAGVSDAVAQNDFHAAVRCLAGDFYDTLHTYFDEVRVNVEDDRLRTNRLKTVRAIRDELVKQVADLSKIVFNGEA